MADDILKEVRRLLLHYLSAGHSCILGPCPEGSMSCGKILEVRERYNMAYVNRKE